MIELDFRRRLGSLQLQVQANLPSQGITAVFGRSGSGKTSLVNAVAGLLRPDEGHIRVEGRVFFDAAARIDLPMEQRGIGYVFQDARLFPHLSVAGNLRYGLKRCRREAVIGFDAVVDVLGIGHLLERRPHVLSGGERQRVALGRALLRQPALLLMDEPLAALDAPRKAEVLPYIERLCREFRLPALYVSHAVEEITRLAQHLVIVSEGRTMASGELTEVMSRPEYAPLIGRFEAGVVIECRVARHDGHYQLSTLSFADGELRVPLVDLPVGTPVRARLRARDVAVSLSAPTDVSLTNRLQGVVASMARGDGPYVDVAIDLGTTLVRALVTRESCDRLRLAVGQPAWAMVKSVALDSRSVGYARMPRATDGELEP